VIRGAPYDGYQADVWSYGVILVALLAGHLPFNAPAARDIIQKVRVGRFTMAHHITDPHKDLVEKMIVVSPAKRIRMQEIKEHPAFRFGLVDGYRVPEPLPQDGGSVHAESVPNEFREMLRWIGYDLDSSITEAPGSSQMTNAKMLYHLFVKRFGGEAAAEREPLQFENISMDMTKLMLKLQGFLTECGFEWAHPSNIELRGTKQEAMVRLIGRYTTGPTVTLTSYGLDEYRSEIERLVGEG
jgi:serine/threonine protein kinase